MRVKVILNWIKLNKPNCTTAYFVLCDVIANWHGFLDITYIKVNKSAILNSIELNIFREYPSQKLHILFYSNGLAIWHGIRI